MAMQISGAKVTGNLGDIMRFRVRGKELLIWSDNPNR